MHFWENSQISSTFNRGESVFFFTILIKKKILKAEAAHMRKIYFLAIGIFKRTTQSFCEGKQWTQYIVLFLLRKLPKQQQQQQQQQGIKQWKALLAGSIKTEGNGFFWQSNTQFFGERKQYRNFAFIKIKDKIFNILPFLG